MSMSPWIALQGTTAPLASAVHCVLMGAGTLRVTVCVSCVAVHFPGEGERVRVTNGPRVVGVFRRNVIFVTDSLFWEMLGAVVNMSDR